MVSAIYWIIIVAMNKIELKLNSSQGTAARKPCLGKY